MKKISLLERKRGEKVSRIIEEIGKKGIIWRRDEAICKE